MANYIALIEEDHGVFGAWFPDCPGCTAMGGSVDEAVGNATNALREWMADRVADGVTPPVARTIVALRTQDPKAFTPETVPVMIPLLLDAGRMVRANISLDAGLLEAIDAAAKARGLTRSAFLASAARDKIAA